MDIFSKRLLLSNIKKGIKKVVGNHLYTYILTDNGELYSTCSPSSFNNYKIQPLFVYEANNIQDIVVNNYGDDTHIFYLDKNNNMYGKGANYQGELGLGDTTKRTQFTFIASNVKSIFSFISTTFYIDLNNNLYGAGRYVYGSKSGNKNITTFTLIASNVKNVYSNYAQSVCFITLTDDLYGAGEYTGGSSQNFTKISSNIKDCFIPYSGIFYITNDYKTYYRGDTNNTYTITDSTFSSSSFRQQYSTFNIDKIYFPTTSTTTREILIKTTDGKVYCSGQNANKCLVNSSSTSVMGISTGISNAVKCFLGLNKDYTMSYHYILDTDGNLKAYGSNYYGQLGNGTTSNITSYYTIDTDVTDFFAFSGDIYNACLFYIKRDGSLYCVGNNRSLNLGIKTLPAIVSTPINISNELYKVVADGSQTVNLNTGKYTVICIGGSSGYVSATSCYGSSFSYKLYQGRVGAASGACFIGDVQLNADTYELHEGQKIDGKHQIKYSKGVAIVNGTTATENNHSYIKCNNNYLIKAEAPNQGSAAATYSSSVSVTANTAGNVIISNTLSNVVTYKNQSSFIGTTQKIQHTTTASDITYTNQQGTLVGNALYAEKYSFYNMDDGAVGRIMILKK